ncbi:MAG: alpha/beta hydrolase [Ignavibacteria bacterium]|nr:alpha/beta hydrolase [Ignavibacteria bacterium]
MQTENLEEYCSPGAFYRDERIEVSPEINLRLITFTPSEHPSTPPIVFVAGWISLIKGWKEVLQELTRDFTVYYVETREKISSKVEGRVGYGVEEIAADLVRLINRLEVQSGMYVLLGSSLGATAILESYRLLVKKPRCLVLIGPNAAFRVPAIWKIIVTLFYPGLYALIRPAVKWYLRMFRLDVRADQAQYEKYCDALDAADAWKLKKAVKSVWSYEVWSVLRSVDCPTLIVNASKDKLHEPDSLRKMTASMTNATEIDLETNARTHSRDVAEAVRSHLARLSPRQ